MEILKFVLSRRMDLGGSFDLRKLTETYTDTNGSTWLSDDGGKSFYTKTPGGVHRASQAEVFNIKKASSNIKSKNPIQKGGVHNGLSYIDVNRIRHYQDGTYYNYKTGGFGNYKKNSNGTYSYTNTGARVNGKDIYKINLNGRGLSFNGTKWTYSNSNSDTNGNGNGNGTGNGNGNVSHTNTNYLTSNFDNSQYGFKSQDDVRRALQFAANYGFNFQNSTGKNGNTYDGIAGNELTQAMNTQYGNTGKTIGLLYQEYQLQQQNPNLAKQTWENQHQLDLENLQTKINQDQTPAYGTTFNQTVYKIGSNRNYGTRGTFIKDPNSIDGNIYSAYQLHNGSKGDRVSAYEHAMLNNGMFTYTDNYGNTYTKDIKGMSHRNFRNFIDSLGGLDAGNDSNLSETLRNNRDFAMGRGAYNNQRNLISQGGQTALKGYVSNNQANLQQQYNNLLNDTYSNHMVQYNPTQDAGSNVALNKESNIKFNQQSLPTFNSNITTLNLIDYGKDALHKPINLTLSTKQGGKLWKTSFMMRGGIFKFDIGGKAAEKTSKVIEGVGKGMERLGKVVKGTSKASKKVTKTTEKVAETGKKAASKAKKTSKKNSGYVGNLFDHLNPVSKERSLTTREKPDYSKAFSRNEGERLASSYREPVRGDIIRSQVTDLPQVRSGNSGEGYTSVLWGLAKPKRNILGGNYIDFEEMNPERMPARTAPKSWFSPITEEGEFVQAQRPVRDIVPYLGSAEAEVLGVEPEEAEVLGVEPEIIKTPYETPKFEVRGTKKYNAPKIEVRAQKVPESPVEAITQSAKKPSKFKKYLGRTALAGGAFGLGAILAHNDNTAEEALAATPSESPELTLVTNTDDGLEALLQAYEQWLSSQNTGENDSNVITPSDNTNPESSSSEPIVPTVAAILPQTVPVGPNILVAPGPVLINTIPSTLDVKDSTYFYDGTYAGLKRRHAAEKSGQTYYFRDPLDGKIIKYDPTIHTKDYFKYIARHRNEGAQQQAAIALQAALLALLQILNQLPMSPGMLQQPIILQVVPPTIHKNGGLISWKTSFKFRKK